MRAPFSVFLLLALLALPAASAVVPHYERGVGQLFHERVVDGVVVCRTEGNFTFDTSPGFLGAGLFAGSSRCGEIVDSFDGCENGDTGWHFCWRGRASGPHARLEVRDEYEQGWPTAVIDYRRVDADGAVDRVEGVALLSIGLTV